MRIGVVIPATATPDARCQTARAAEEIGLDFVAVEAGRFDPLILAASLAHHTEAVRIVVQIEAGMHPIRLAERVFVTDQSLGGRLVVVLRGAGDSDVLAETVEVILRAATGRPVRFNGKHWSVPAKQSEFLTVTPGPAQLRLPLWLSGPGAEEVAGAFGLPLVASDDNAAAAARWWKAAERRWGQLNLDLPRPMLAQLDTDESGEFADLVASLRAHGRAWELDTVLLRIGDAGPGGLDVVARMRASLQLDALPAGIQEFWADTLPLDPLTDL